MPVPTLITDLDTVANNNSPPGTESAKGNIDNYIRTLSAFIKQTYSASVAPVTVTIASSATPAIGAAASNNIIISGVVTITGFDTVAEGLLRFVTFSGALTLTHNATSLILPGAANITTTAGDVALFKSLGSGNWRCMFYQYGGGLLPRAGGTLTGALNEKHGADIASAATINLTTADGNLVDVTGTTTITAVTLADGAERTVRFTGILTLTNGASLVLPSAANITTAAGDFAVFRGYAASVVRCVAYTRADGTPLVAVVDASTSVKGKVQLATSAEAVTGTDALKAITPSTMKAGLNATGTAPTFAARAYVNFNGTGTVAIRTSGNVSSITDGGTGIYTANFTTAMPVNSFTVGGLAGAVGATAADTGAIRPYNYQVGSISIQTINGAATALADYDTVNITIHC